MSGGSIERLPSGRWRAVVRAGRDPITKRYIKLTETCATEGEAIAARERMLAQVEAGSHPDRAATVASLMERWMDVVDHELSTAETTAGYVRRTINPALGEWTLRKLQHRVDILDRLYKHLGRCNVLCDGRPFVEHARSDAHDCEKAGCRPHRCKPMAPSTIRRIHAILSSALNYAISWGWIEKNPATYAHPPKLSRRRARPQSPDKVVQLLNAASERDVELGVFLWLAVTTGARRGEVTALRWPSVDFEQRLLGPLNRRVSSPSHANGVERIMNRAKERSCQERRIRPSLLHLVMAAAVIVVAVGLASCSTANHTGDTTATSLPGVTSTVGRADQFAGSAWRLEQIEHDGVRQDIPHDLTATLKFDHTAVLINDTVNVINAKYMTSPDGFVLTDIIMSYAQWDGTEEPRRTIVKAFRELTFAGPNAGSAPARVEWRASVVSNQIVIQQAGYRLTFVPSI